MSYWERNTLILLAGSVFGAVFYFGFVIAQSVAAGAVVMPQLWVWLGYIVFQFAVSVGGVWLLNRKGLAEVRDLVGGEDERDLVIKKQAEARQGHIMSALILFGLAFWFIHGSAALLFHSMVAALVVSELCRGLIQYASYSRAI
ncbi:MAG: hypothetical protein AAGI14_06700 [Pseudomonadota bacterium]